MSRPIVSAVVFDLDNTLVDRQRAFARWATRQVSCRSPPWSRGRRHAAVEEAMHVDGWGAAPERAVKRLATLLELNEASLQSQFFAELAGDLRVDLRIHGLLHWLAMLGIPLAIATNGRANNQRRKLAAAQLDEFPWAAVAVGEELGRAKPDPEFFAHLERQLDLPAEELLMVGDDWLRDIRPAAERGWRTCWVSRRRERPAVGTADLIVEQAADLRAGPRPFHMRGRLAFLPAAGAS